jgi:hypothetical protein
MKTIKVNAEPLSIEPVTSLDKCRAAICPSATVAIFTD